MQQTTSSNLVLSQPMAESPITVGMFLERSTSYEREWPTPLDVHLRRHLMISLASTVGAIPLSMLLLALFSSGGAGGFFLFGGALAVGTLELILSPVGITAIVLTLLGYTALWYVTDGLEYPTWRWHQVAFGLAVVGTVFLALLGVPVLLMAVNLAAWVVVGIVMAIVALVLFIVRLLIILACIIGVLLWLLGGGLLAAVR